ncbi:polysaccharide deacetylase family protein [Hazenella sp. IB182357]|uniref:Polysaccharide deacetylase family protein n=2 Tax=Polycladospora coralii TaxID=2771432 RepID=A0A926NA10_9BACL|nr:polysaccharide deacetylase family protein [Polycladospora coralii]MBS7529207.1 polysaccharide deacetylase family protein [Polycladospora coralii]
MLLCFTPLILTGCIYSTEVDASARISKPKQINKEARFSELKEIRVSYQDKKEYLQYQKKALIFHGPTVDKKVALTFDDGPDRHYTYEILAILKKEQVSATFFVVGKMAEIYPDVLKKMDQEGHIIGNHSYSHPLLTKRTNKQILAEVSRTDQAVAKAVGKKPILMRPPYGATNEMVLNTLINQQYKIINWSVDTQDWKGPSAHHIVATVKRQTGPGGIILQHNAGGEQLQATVDALPKMIKHLKANGYQFVTVDELLHIDAYRSSQ